MDSFAEVKSVKAIYKICVNFLLIDLLDDPKAIHFLPVTELPVVF